MEGMKRKYVKNYCPRNSCIMFVSCGKILLTHCEKEIYIYDQNTFGMTAK
jgi:hypothetical protein